MPVTSWETQINPNTYIGKVYRPATRTSRKTKPKRAKPKQTEPKQTKPVKHRDPAKIASGAVPNPNFDRVFGQQDLIPMPLPSGTYHLFQAEEPESTSEPKSHK